MKTVFILNPGAGKKKNMENLRREILLACNSAEETAEVYVTRFCGDARNYVSDYCRKWGKARFIACGGDGTLEEVLNGIVGCDGAEIGVMPLGTGNDFCRNLPCKKAAIKPEAFVTGNTINCDVMKYTEKETGVERYCMNMFNIGFDCNVADMTNTLKGKSFITGSVAYVLSIFVMLLKKKGAALKLELDGKVIHNGKLLLTSVANGCYCGGGIKSNPGASINDGLMDVNIVKNVSRFNFITKLPFYMKGTHTKLKNIEKIITTHKCKKLSITPLNGKMRLCTDGEICTIGEITIDIIPSAIRFVIPDKI